MQKHDILQSHNCKGGHRKMATIIKIGFTFAAKLAYLVIIEINGCKESLTQQSAVTTSLLIDGYISSVSSSCCNLIISSLILYKFWKC